LPDLAVAARAEERDGVICGGPGGREGLRVEGEVREGFGVAVQFVEGVAEVGGGEVPDDEGGVGGAGDEDRGAVGEGGGEEAFEEVGVAVELADGGGAVGEGDGVDGFVPGSGVEGLGVGADGEAGQWGGALVEDLDGFTGL
jgi:hypothetical protein